MRGVGKHVTTTVAVHMGLPQSTEAVQQCGSLSHTLPSRFSKILSAHSIPVYRDEWLDRSSVGLRMQQGKILSIKMLSGKVFHGKIFIDASYEGDLMAAAGVTYTVGREGNDQYKETLNGVQTYNARSHQFKNNISAYTVPVTHQVAYSPVSERWPWHRGSGDHRVQHTTIACA